MSFKRGICCFDFHYHFLISVSFLITNCKGMALPGLLIDMFILYRFNYSPDKVRGEIDLPLSACTPDRTEL